METTDKERYELMLRSMEDTDTSVSKLASILGLRYDVLYKAIYEGKGNNATYNLIAEYFHLPRRLLVGASLDGIPVNPDPTWESITNHVNKVLADSMLPLLSEVESFLRKEVKLNNDVGSIRSIRKTVNEAVSSLWYILGTCTIERDNYDSRET